MKKNYMLAFMLLVWGVGISQTESAMEHFKDVKRVKVEDFSLYPNPIRDQLTIDLPTKREDLKVKVFNGVGELFLEQSLDWKEKNKIDFSAFSAGIYFIEINNDISKLTKRIIKK